MGTYFRPKDLEKVPDFEHLRPEPKTYQTEAEKRKNELGTVPSEVMSEAWMKWDKLKSDSFWTNWSFDRKNCLKMNSK